MTYCQQAGDKALARSAYREAVGSFEQTLEALTHVPESRHTLEPAIDLQLALRTVLYPSGDWGHILAYLQEAESLAVALDDPRRLAQVSVFLSHYFRGEAMYDQAIASRRALALAMAARDVLLQALANQYLGQAYMNQGDYRRAIACVGQAVTSLGGRVTDAVPLLARAIEQSTVVKDGRSESYCCRCMGEAQLLSGCLEEAHAFAERTLALAHDLQERHSQIYTLRLLGEIAMHREPPAVEQAEAYYRQALALAEELGMRSLQAHCHLGLGTVYTQMTRHEQARAESSAAIALYRAMAMTFWLPRAEAALAGVVGLGSLDSVSSF